MKAIAALLNAEGVTMRGQPWRVQKICNVLSDITYRGEYCYNMRDSRRNILRPESEWVRCEVEPIVDEATFDQARRKREAQDPKKLAPQGKSVKNATSSILLAGLIKCGVCGCAMTLATGKGGRYRYYKCSHKSKRPAESCRTPNLPMDQMDQMILTRLIDQVLTPERVVSLLKAHLRRQESLKSETDVALDRLGKALRAKEAGLENLYRAIEQGVIALDGMLQARVNQLKDEREKLLTEMALLKRDKPSFRKVSPNQVAYAVRRLKEMLLDSASGRGKAWLNALVEEIRVEPKDITVRGSAAALEQVVSELKPGTPTEVPGFVMDWRARRDSNARPLASEANTLSI